MIAGTAPRSRRNRGVALGVLGTLLLAFFAIVFMLGRHSYFHDIMSSQHHDPRHGHGPVTGQDVGRPDAVVASPQPSPVVAASPVPSPVVASSPVPSPVPSPVVAATGGEEEGLSAMDKKYRPTKEMVQGIAQNGYLVVTWANFHYQDFAMTWVAHVKSVGITGYIVGAMDDELLQLLVDSKINTFSMKSGLTTGDFGWGSKTFAKMGREKIRLIALFLRLGVSVVIADVDVLWLQNPLPYFDRFPEADVLTSSDHLANTHDSDELELWPQAASSANIGIMLFREKSLDFVDEWVKIIEADENVWDQNAFNDLFRKGLQNLDGDPKHYFMGYMGTLKMGILPVALFASGHTFFTQRMYEKLGLKPYAVHATFQFSGTPGKRNRMREHMFFEDKPEYYDHKKGFLTFEMDGIEPLLKDAGPRTGKMEIANVVGHFELVNHQMKRIRSALAISSILGRVFVAPELWCGLDRWWAPHAGTIPGSAFKLPFKCPLDHVFDLETWSRELSPDHGPNIEYRESSFFQNPRMPAAVNNSRCVVEVCPAGTEGCSDGSSPAEVKDGKVRIQEGLLSEQIKTALKNTEKFKILDFSSMATVFKNFTVPADWNKFAQRMKSYASIWCCIHAHPGHIHYDMLFDVPHNDKFNRPWNGTFEIVAGP